jgi:hypothetical protein
MKLTFDLKTVTISYVYKVLSQLILWTVAVADPQNFYAMMLAYQSGYESGIDEYEFNPILKSRIQDGNDSVTKTKTKTAIELDAEIKTQLKTQMKAETESKVQAWVKARDEAGTMMIMVATIVVLVAEFVYDLHKFKNSTWAKLVDQILDNIILIFPEEIRGELGSLKQRMEKRKTSIWKIRFRLFQEWVGLLWAFYVQIRLENLMLPDRNRTGD